jgi:uncharacterized protein (TIGR04255 family)
VGPGFGWERSFFIWQDKTNLLAVGKLFFEQMWNILTLDATSCRVDFRCPNRHLRKCLVSRTIEGVYQKMSEPEIAQNGRPKAPGYPSAPIVEAVFAVHPREDFQNADLEGARDKLAIHYPKCVEMPFAEFSYDAEAATLDVKPNRPTYRLEGENASEVTLLRPDGLFVSKLAPYCSWDDLFERFKRDFLVLSSLFDSNGVNRIACRYINRIDVPLDGKIARNEDYLSVYIHVPESIEAIGRFQLRFELAVPEIQSTAVIQSGLILPFPDDHASFALDIDLVRNFDVNITHSVALVEFLKFREPKNRLYRQFLTQKALDQFQ